jgi:chromate reductase, NAD(P)H dehydrogenase (quinone)
VALEDVAAAVSATNFLRAVGTDRHDGLPREALADTVRILGVSGSLQSGSTNAALLDVARARMPADMEVVVFNALARIAPFNPEIEPPAAVERLRAMVGLSDGVLFATPEYAHGLPGVLKNALDWLVGSGELYGKRVVIVSAAPSAERGWHARADLARTLRAQGAVVLSSTTIAVPASARGHEIDDPNITAAVDHALATFT